MRKARLELIVTNLMGAGLALRAGAAAANKGQGYPVTDFPFGYFIPNSCDLSGQFMPGTVGHGNIGIVTHCCCPNWGTRMDHPNVVAARETLCPTSPPQAAGLTSVNVVVGNPVSGSLPELQATDGNYLVVDSVNQGVRNSALTIVEAQSPFSTVNELNVSVVYGPVDVNPVFLLVALLNYDTGIFDTQVFGILNVGSATVVELDGVPSPNQYVNGSGQIQVRVPATSRQPQTPDGFTKLIDSVSVSVQP